MIDFIIELIPPRLLGFIIGVLFIVGGVWVWQSGTAERTLYDNAVGPGSVTYDSRIRFKRVRSESTSGINDHDTGSADVCYLTVGYDDADGKYHSMDVAVDRDEYDSVKEDGMIKISFHPGFPEYVVTPMETRPGVLWYRIGAILLLIVGVFVVLAIIISLF